MSRAFFLSETTYQRGKRESLTEGYILRKSQRLEKILTQIKPDEKPFKIVYADNGVNEGGVIVTDPKTIIVNFVD